MHGTAGRQYQHNLKLIGFGDGRWGWQNTATGYVSNIRYETADEAQSAIDDIVGNRADD